MSSLAAHSFFSNTISHLGGVKVIPQSPCIDTVPTLLGRHDHRKWATNEPQ